MIVEGSVGIGTTSPSEKLSIDSGDISITTGYGIHAVNGGNENGMFFHAAAAGNSGNLLNFKTDGSERMRIDSSGNVGIGTASPNKKLEVVDSAAAQILAKGWGPDSAGNDGGAIQLGEEAAFHGLFSYDNATSILYIDNAYNSAAGDIRFRTKTSGTAITAVTIEGDGDVGIGTASPASKLHVYGADPVLTIQDSESTVANASAILRIGESDGSANLNNNFAIKFVGTASGGDLDFSRYNNTTIVNQGLRIKHDGNVGIGTTNPSTDFSVKEHLLFNDSTRLLTISNNTNTGGINLDGGNTRLYFSGYRALEGNNNGTTLTVGEGYGTTRISSLLNVVDHETILSPDQGSSSGVASRTLTIENINDSSWTADALTSYNATTSYDIRDLASYSFFARPTQGNILTFASETANNGTLHRFVNLNSSAAEPLYRWDFYQYDGSGTGAGDFQVPDKLFQIRVREGVSNVEKFTIKGNGNVGIGVTNPSQPLHILDGNAPSGTPYANGSMLIAGHSTIGLNFYGNDSSTQHIYFGSPSDTTGASIRYEYDGFGSSVPELLIGTSTSNGIVTFGTGTGAEKMRIDASGNVGIGTTSPAEKLDVVGNVKHQGLTMTSGTDIDQLKTCHSNLNNNN